jgi:hypothetical protein
VKKFFEQLVKTEQLKTPISPEAIDTIVRCIGGEVDDLDRVVVGLRRGDSYINVKLCHLRDPICADSSEYVDR